MTRRPAELLARIVGVGALALALTLMLRSTPRAVQPAAYALSPAALRDSTARMVISELQRFGEPSAAGRPSVPLHATFGRIPGSQVRSALATARAAGMPITWTDSTAAAGLAISASAEADPEGGFVIRATSAAPPPLTVRDNVSLLDSTSDGSRALVVQGTRVSGAAVATQGASRASASVPAPAVLRRVLLAATPGWESKFVAAALEERGWHVDGSLLIARRASVTLGAPLPLDTARYAAVVVLDSGVLNADVLTRFARQGGGVILAGDALAATALAPLRPASAGSVRAPIPGALLTDAPRQGLDAFELRPASRAVVLRAEARGARREPSVVAWRVGAGRVLASAYRETWRWRMEGTDDGIDEHREWWSGLVSAAAFVPADSVRARTIARAAATPGDAAPYADLVARLGAPSNAPPLSDVPHDSPTRLWPLFLIACIALLTEWALRRLRGAP